LHFRRFIGYAGSNRVHTRKRSFVSNKVAIGNPIKGGAYLTQLREQRGMTRTGVSDATDGIIIDDTLRKLERGGQKGGIENPKMVDMGVLSKLFGVTLDSIAEAYEYPYHPCSNEPPQHPLIWQLSKAYNEGNERAREYLELSIESLLQTAGRLNRGD
jgi:transcriptional regulator with XRE-family HTH domain